MNDPMQHPGVSRQRCGRCGKPLEPKPETDVRTEMPATLLGFPVWVLCGECKPRPKAADLFKAKELLDRPKTC